MVHHLHSEAYVIALVRDDHLNVTKYCSVNVKICSQLHHH